MSSRPYLPFVDWMKALGITLIIVGHVAGAPINGLTPPIYPKQLGVAFFIFVAGYSLARERRPISQVLFNRLFEIYLFGVLIAILLSATTFASRGSLALSNYLPFLAGANVVFNNFPANPTTWYIGTYIQVLLVWAVVRNVTVRPAMLLVSVPAEVLARMLLIDAGREYVAYMFLTNWASVFLLGTLCGQRQSLETRRVWTAAVAASVLVIFTVGWHVRVDRLIVERSFPFMNLTGFGLIPGRVLAPVCVSALYLSFTSLAYLATRAASPPPSIRFLARNTLILFIGHMPLFYALNPLLLRRGLGYGARSLVHVAVCLVGLAVLSEFLMRLARTRELRDRILSLSTGSRASTTT